jgi:hypothetical protein
MLFAVYSIPGAGKTLCAAGFMKLLHEITGKPCLYGDWEGGHIVIPDDIPYILWVPDQADPTDDAFDLAEAALSNDVSGLVTDTISSMGEAITAATTKKNLYQESGSKTVRVGAKTDSGRKICVPTLNDYRYAQNTFQQWARVMPKLFEQGKHAMWVAHEHITEVSDPGGNKDLLGGPEIIGSKLTRTAPKLPHITARISCKKVMSNNKPTLSRFFQTEVDGLYLAKDRINALPRGGIHMNVDPSLGGQEMVAAIIERSYQIWKVVFQSKGYLPK